MTDEHAVLERLVAQETRMEGVLKRMEDLVTKQEFWVVKVVTLGMAGGILTAFLAAIITKAMGNA